MYALCLVTVYKNYLVPFFLLSDTKACHVIQLSAISDDEIFDAYAVPLRPISKRAAELTGFSVRGNRLFRNDVLLPTMPFLQILTSFLEYLRSFRRPVLLAAHNGTYFDAPVLGRVLRQYHLQKKFKKVVSGFLDTCQLCKILFPDLGVYNLKFLVKYFLNKSFDAHNALEDASMLQELFHTWKPSPQDIPGPTYPASDFM